MRQTNLRSDYCLRLMILDRDRNSNLNNILNKKEKANFLFRYIYFVLE